MLRAPLIVLGVFVCISGACATGGAGGGGNDDAGGSKDGGIIIAKDGGTTQKDSSAPKDAGPLPDTGGACQKAPSSNVCGVYPQCGCGAQQTCEVSQSALDGTSSCVAAGTKGIGQSCAQTAGECAAGLTCVWNECHAYCGTAGAKCGNPNTNYCVNLTDGKSNPIPNFLICHNDCELSDPSSCGGGAEGCLYFGVDTVDCYPVGTTTANCNATTSFCPAGQICLTDQTNYFCLPWCRVGGNDCTSGTCNSLGTGAPMVNGTEYGYCQ